MGSTIVAILTVGVLLAWHWRNKRHPNWSVSPDGRFYVTLGYPAVAIGAYWLTMAPTDTAWEWAVGNLWALTAMVSFVVGFNALNAAAVQQQQASKAIESISPIKN